MAKVYSKDSIKLPLNIDACICNKLGGLICTKEFEAMVCRTEWYIGKYRPKFVNINSHMLRPVIEFKVLNNIALDTA
jgi:hypothetical protein